MKHIQTFESITEAKQTETQRMDGMDAVFMGAGKHNEKVGQISIESDDSITLVMPHGRHIANVNINDLRLIESITEGGMSDIYQLADESKDEAAFIKDFFKEFGDKVKKTPDSIKWAKTIYADSIALTLEGTLIDLRLVNENVEDDIEAALTNWLNTLADGNAVAISDLYLENAVLIGTLAEDIKQGREQIQGYFERFLKSSPIGSVDSFILQNYGDICISDGNYTFEMDSESGSRESVSARYTYVWKKENKKWMIASHHSSAEPKNN
jgi:uncharacterized protein (TIGR02246 family)